MNLLQYMRRSTTMQAEVPLTTNSQVFIPADQKRVSLLISSPQTNRISLGFGKTAVLDQGINIDPGDPPLQLSLLLHGDMVRQQITAISALANQTVSYVASSCDDVGS